MHSKFYLETNQRQKVKSMNNFNPITKKKITWIKETTKKKSAAFVSCS